MTHEDIIEAFAPKQLSVQEIVSIEEESEVITEIIFQIIYSKTLNSHHNHEHQCKPKKEGGSLL